LTKTRDVLKGGAARKENVMSHLKYERATRGSKKTSRVEPLYMTEYKSIFTPRSICLSIRDYGEVELFSTYLAANV
jgi:hypothetical protein